LFSKFEVGYLPDSPVPITFSIRKVGKYKDQVLQKWIETETLLHGGFKPGVQKGAA